MAVAELPLPPFPYEKDFFGSPFPKGAKKSALPIFGKKSNKEKSNGRTRKTAMYKAILSLYFLIVFHRIPPNSNTYCEFISEISFATKFTLAQIVYIHLCPAIYLILFITVWILQRLAGCLLLCAHSLFSED